MVHGTPMVVRVFEQARKVFDNVCVATDDSRIFDTVEKFGGVAVMTSEKHRSGTDRCLEALNNYSSNGKVFDGVVNVQGDEPFISPIQLKTLADTLMQDGVDIATIVKRADCIADIADPNRPKVVLDKNNNALYFSRSPIPFNRARTLQQEDLEHISYYLHVGLYGYRCNILKQICSLPESFLEQTEKLEQLRWLENGFRIRVAECNQPSFGIDTPEDLKRVNNIKIPEQ